MTLPQAILAALVICASVFAIWCKLAPYGEEIDGVGFVPDDKV